MQNTDKKYLNRMKDFGEVLDRQHSHYGSGVIREMIENGGVMESQKTGIHYRIPTHFGFCYGVEKSIDMAFETVNRFPDRRIFLTHDVIHNPKVNQDLKDKNVTVLDRDNNNELILDGIKADDIVVISAFGSKVKDVASLKKKDCVIVDTTCGAIVVVWKRVEKYAKNGFTSLIHGIWNHEETQATASQSSIFGGHFLILRNKEEAKKIESFLKNEISSEQFMQQFEEKSSEGFDPSLHLKKVGIASQTTMLMSETLELQEYLKSIYSQIYTNDSIDQHVMKYDTICSATQERQDALQSLLEGPLDLMLIIGGFNSSNTTHLSEIASLKFPTFHIQGAHDIISKDEIHYLDPTDLKTKTKTSWIPNNVKNVGISTGASTPDISIEKVIQRCEDLF